MCVLYTAQCILLNGRSGTISSDERWTLDAVVPLTLESVRFLESVRPVFIEHFLAPLCPKYRTVTSKAVFVDTICFHNLSSVHCSLKNFVQSRIVNGDIGSQRMQEQNDAVNGQNIYREP